MRFLILSVIANLIPTFASASIAEANTKLIKAGADSSGGGKSVVCREGGQPEGKILSIELLDLYEARAMFGLEPLPLGDSYEAALATAKERFTHTTFDAPGVLPGALDRLSRKIRIMPPGTRLEPVDDASPVVLPRGCGLEQTAVWVDASLVVADHELWNAMDARNKVALLAHELIYNATRGEGHKNSRRARKIVGHVLSRTELVGAREQRPAGAKLLCVSGDAGTTYSQFWLYPNEEGTLVAQIEIFHNAWLYSRSTATFTDIPWDPAKQTWTVHDWAEIDSLIEAGKDFGIEAALKEGGGRELFALELNEKGEFVRTKLTCL